MAYEVLVLDRSYPIPASTDLSASQYCAVSMSTTGVVLPSGNTDTKIIGVLQNKAAGTSVTSAGSLGQGDVAQVMVYGVTKMVTDTAAVAVGDRIMVTNAGKAVTATTGKYSIGICEGPTGGGSGGAIISVLLQYGIFD